ncbi:MAG: hypothetical protein AB7D02_01600 [Candidatus Paceibacterota bacterium]
MSILLNFFYPLFIILGVLGLIVLLSRTKEEEEIVLIYKKKLESLREKEKKLKEKIFEKLSPSLSQALLNILEKSLSRLRVIVLRLDNFVFKSLKKIREVKFKNIEVQEEAKLTTNLVEGFEEEEESLKDLKKEERTYLRKIQKGDVFTYQNLARLYLYEGDFSSARWVILEGYRRFPNEKIFEAFLLELFEKEKLYFERKN